MMMMMPCLVVPTRALIAAALVLIGSQGWANAGDQPTGFTLSNGLRVRLVVIPGESKVAVLLGVRAGFFDEPSGFPHLAHVAEHLVVFGAPPGSDEGKAVARWYEARKANAETLPGFMYLDLHVEATELDAALRVQAARLIRPAFTDPILRREVPRTLAELEYLEQPETYGTGKFAFSAFVQAVLHGRTEVPLKARTRGITVEDVRLFHARTFRVDRAMLVIVGGFDTAPARKAVEDAFGAIPVPATTSDRLPAPRTEGPVTARWDASTHHLILAWRTPPASDPDHAAMTLASTVLTQRLPFDRDIAALAKSPIVTNEVEGFFLVNVQVKPGADGDALRAKLRDQISRLATPEGFGDARVDQARQEFLRTIDPSPLRQLVASARSSPLRARTNVELQRMARAIIWGDLDAYVKRVEALDGGKVRDAVARLLDPGRAIVVRVEPMR
jgi:predicted Zn-dependent peptidase